MVLEGQADYIMLDLLGDCKALDFYSENPVDGFGQGHDLSKQIVLLHNVNSPHSMPCFAFNSL